MFRYQKICHGCSGKGWVVVDGKAVRCPVCNGKGVIDAPKVRWFF